MAEEQDRSAALRGLLGGVARSAAERVRQELAANGEDGGVRPAEVPRAAAAALGGLVSGVGQDVAGLVRNELGAARRELADTARAGARGAGLLGAAAATGNTAVLFTGVALWRGLGARIGYTRSAVVVAGVSAAATAVLAAKGVEDLGRVRRRRRPQ